MKDLGGFTVAAQDIRALSTTRADRACAGDSAHSVRREPASPFQSTGRLTPFVFRALAHFVRQDTRHSTAPQATRHPNRLRFSLTAFAGMFIHRQSKL